MDNKVLLMVRASFRIELQVANIAITSHRHKLSELKLLQVSEELPVALLNSFSIGLVGHHQTELLKLGKQLTEDCAKANAIKVSGVSTIEASQLEVSDPGQRDQTELESSLDGHFKADQLQLVESAKTDHCVEDLRIECLVFLEMKK